MTQPSMQFPGNLSKRWRFLTGSASEFSLEARIFHSISLGIAALTLAYTPYNFYAGLIVAAVSCMFFSAAFFYEYYRSRFLQRPYRSFIFGISGLILLSVNYFANAGIEGSTDLIWPGYLLLLLTICPYNQMVKWVAVYLIVFGLVHVAEHQYPGLVQYPFRAGSGQFTDRITAFPIPVIGMAIIIGLFRRNYDKERTAVVQRDLEKSRLLSILSHDLRAPFAQIQQYFELLNENMLSPEERREIERALRLSSDQTLNLVTNLLYWSRSQLEGFSIRITTLPLLATLKNTLDIAGRLSAEKGIALSVHIHPEMRVKADADMLQLVVRNLLQNAIKFTSPGGTIRVEAQSSANNCMLSVIDNGVGIEEEQMNRLFSGTLTTAGTANEKGVGLGLQVCKEFMTLQKGNIQAYSTPDGGTRFTVSIPLV